MWMVEGAVHFLASIASSVIWMLITTLLWVGAGNIIALPVVRFLFETS